MSTNKVFSGKAVEKALLKKGFVKEDRDHKYFVFLYEGKKTKVKTKTSHNDQDIGSSLISQMAKQLRLDKREFCDLINCPLTKEKYIAILKNKKEI